MYYDLEVKMREFKVGDVVDFHHSVEETTLESGTIVFIDPFGLLTVEFIVNAEDCTLVEIGEYTRDKS